MSAVIAKYLVYGLMDPRTLMVRYIGKSSSGLKRPKRHRRTKAKTRCGNWVRSLESAGVVFEIVILESTTKESLAACERWWIAYGKASCWNLTNLTNGGEGDPGKNTSPELRAARSVIAKRMWSDPVFHASRTGDNHHAKRPEVASSISAALRRVLNTEDGRERTTAGALKRWATPGYREKLSGANHLSRRWDPEERSTLMSAAQGSPQARENHRQSSLLAWQVPGRRESASLKTKHMSVGRWLGLQLVGYSETK